MQDVVCPLSSKAESKGVEIRVVDGHVAHLTFMQKFASCHRPAIEAFLLTPNYGIYQPLAV